MKLKELMTQIKDKFQVDEQLRAYLYKDRIKFIDYTSKCVLKNGKKLDDFYGNLMSIYLKENKISCIECNIINLITPANIEAINFLTSLINIEIEDYNSYKYLTSLEDIKQFEVL